MAEETKRVAYFSPEFGRRIWRVVKLVESFRIAGRGVKFHKGKESMSAHIGGGASSGSLRRFRVKEVFNDYLRCREWDGTTESGFDEFVARRPELRHAASWYEGVTTLVTVDAQTATMDDGAGAQTYKVTPAYIVDVTEIWPTPVDSSGVTVSGDDLKLIDMTPRQWVLDNTS